MSQADANESARKKTQARQTKWKVTIRARQSGHPVARRRRCAAALPPPALARQAPTPWRPPQTTNVQAAPCHRPPSSIVSIRLR